MTSSRSRWIDLELVKEDAVKFVQLKRRLCYDKAYKVFNACRDLQVEWLDVMSRPIFDHMLAHLWQVFMVRFEILELMCNESEMMSTSLKTYIEGMSEKKKRIVPMVDLSQISVIALIHDEAEEDIMSKTTTSEVQNAKNRLLQAIRFCVEMCAGVKSAITAFLCATASDQRPRALPAMNVLSKADEGEVMKPALKKARR